MTLWQETRRRRPLRSAWYIWLWALFLSAPPYRLSKKDDSENNTEKQKDKQKIYIFHPQGCIHNMVVLY